MKTLQLLAPRPLTGALPLEPADEPLPGPNPGSDAAIVIL